MTRRDAIVLRRKGWAEKHACGEKGLSGAKTGSVSVD